jgi:hypothetical protein
LQSSIELLSKACDGSLVDNFIAVGLGKVDDRDWWDNSSDTNDAWAIVYEHHYQAAFIAGASGCRGIVMDLESMGSPPFNTHPNFNSLSDYHQYRYNNVIPRAAQLVKELQEGFREGSAARGANPDDDFVIYLDRGLYSLDTDLGPYEENDPAVLSGWMNGIEQMHCCFLNGMIQGAGLQMQFIDACEPESYGIWGDTGRSGPTAPCSYDDILGKWVKSSENGGYSATLFTGVIASKYRKQWSPGYIFWLLGTSRDDPQDLNRLEALASKALSRSVKYLMIYTENYTAPKPQYRWFLLKSDQTADPTLGPVPAGYETIVRYLSGRQG